MAQHVVLINLGTPDSYKRRDVHKYLVEFLTDPYVIDIPWLPRQLLVRGLIAPLRSGRSAKFYKRIWQPEGSPLRIHTEAAAAALQEALPDWKVHVAMRYQSPSIASVFANIPASDEVVCIPLFPQRAQATTGSIIEKVKEVAPLHNVRFVEDFYDQPQMIAAFCDRAKSLAIDSYDHILFSYHGLPIRQLKKSDKTGRCQTPSCCETPSSCYGSQCVATTNAIAKSLNLPRSKYTLCYQSRLGQDAWIRPYTSDVLQKLAKAGAKRLLVFCPAFVADCIETLHEICIEYEEEFQALGGESITLVPSLNSHPFWIEALKELTLSCQTAQVALCSSS